MAASLPILKNTNSSSSSVFSSAVPLRVSIAHKFSICSNSFFKPPQIYSDFASLRLSSSNSTLLRLHKVLQPCYASTSEQQHQSQPNDNDSGNNEEQSVNVNVDASVVEDEDEDDAHVDDSDNTIIDATTDGEEVDQQPPSSPVLAALSSFKEAIATNDQSKVTQLESFFQSLENENTQLSTKVVSLSEQLSTERTRLLRISADFDNFRKRTERERLSLFTNAQGEVIENLLSVLDNFERAKSQLKIQTEGEKKINDSYQSIYKQFTEVLASLGVLPVETVGKPFDPLLHEAIMMEESTEYEEGIVLEEFRKGFQIGERLLRTSMVKVSSGPGPAKSESVEQPEEVIDIDSC